MTAYGVCYESSRNAQWTRRWSGSWKETTRWCEYWRKV